MKAADQNEPHAGRLWSIDNLLDDDLLETLDSFVQVCIDDNVVEQASFLGSIHLTVSVSQSLLNGFFRLGASEKFSHDTHEKNKHASNRS